MSATLVKNLLIITANVAICPEGKTVSGTGSTTLTIGVNTPPQLPSDGSIGEPWERIGRVTSSEVTNNDETADVKAGEDNGMYSKEVVDMSVAPTFKFTMADIDKAAFEMMFGLNAGDLDTTAGGQPWAKGSTSRNVWLYLRLSDHRQDGKRLLHGRFYGKLKLTAAPRSAFELATAEFEFTPDVSVASNKVEPLDVTTPGSGGDGEDD